MTITSQKKWPAVPAAAPGERRVANSADGALIGEVQNGGGSRYAGTVMPWQPYDPVKVTIRSTSGGSTIVPTTPFQL